MQRKSPSQSKEIYDSDKFVRIIKSSRYFRNISLDNLKISSGNELISPGEQMEIGKVYDSNSTLIAHAVEELGCEAVRFGIVD